jgi:hypothetical protein
MNKLIVAAVATLFAATLVHAQPSAKGDGNAAAPAAPSMPAAAAAGGDCDARAIDKNGKPLHGAAKSAFMKKCMRAGAGETAGKGPAGNADCEARAIGKDGKPLHGAAKGRFMKKCEAAGMK